jgi:hypothetical protein
MYVLLDDRDNSTTAQEGVYGIGVVHQRIVLGRERFTLSGFTKVR